MRASVPGGQSHVRVRFAPSPSGDLHVGNIRTALYDWAFARHTGGTFVLRIEDTDASRVTPEYIASAQETLRWLGVDWDEGPETGGPFGPYLQSQRMPVYREWARRFLESGDAYCCYCTQREVAERRARRIGSKTGPSGYDGHCRALTAGQLRGYQGEGRKPVVRMRMRPGSTTFTDLVRGEVTFGHEHVPDFVLVRADGSPPCTRRWESRRLNSRCLRICHSCSGWRARSSASATAPPRSAGTGRRGSCRRQSATTWRCSAGLQETTAKISRLRTWRRSSIWRGQQKPCPVRRAQAGGHQR